MAWAIIDTSIYIGHWERHLYEAVLEMVEKTFVVRHSAVVLSELRRGAKSVAARRLVEALRAQARIQWEPNAADWWEAGGVIAKVGDAQRWERAKRREFQNDVLVALTARRHGAAVVTANRRDFQLLSAELRIPVVFA